MSGAIDVTQEAARFSLRAVRSRPIKVVRKDGSVCEKDWRELVIRIRDLEWLFEKDASAKQSVCAGAGARPCPDKAVPTKKAFYPSTVAFRRGGPWRCVKCAKASITPEQEAEALRKRLNARTHEQRREAAARAIAKRTPEQRKALASRASKAKTAESRSQAARKGWRK